MTRLTERISETWIKVFLIKAQNSYLTGMTEAWQPVLQYSFDSTISWARLLEMKFNFCSFLNELDDLGKPILPNIPSDLSFAMISCSGSSTEVKSNMWPVEKSVSAQAWQAAAKASGLEHLSSGSTSASPVGLFPPWMPFYWLSFQLFFPKEKKKYNKIKNIRNQNVKLIFYKSLHGIITASFLWEGFVTSHISSLK